MKAEASFSRHSGLLATRIGGRINKSTEVRNLMESPRFRQGTFIRKGPEKKCSMLQETPSWLEVTEYSIKQLTKAAGFGCDTKTSSRP